MLIPGWLQLLIGIISLGREVMKYYSKQYKCKKEAAKQINSFKNAVKKATETGDTKDVEVLLADLHNRSK